MQVLAKAIHHTIEFGDFDIYVIEDDNNEEHVVLVRGDIKGGKNVLCRVASECLPGTALFSAECDCKQQIYYAFQLISDNNRGIFIYLRQEGRGHGLSTKIKALANKNKGLDTFEAVECMGLSSDVREYSIVKEILQFFEVKSINCICNNPDKIKALKELGIIIANVVNIPVASNLYSLRHLQAKQKRGHMIRLCGDSN